MIIFSFKEEKGVLSTFSVIKYYILSIYKSTNSPGSGCRTPLSVKVWGGGGLGPTLCIR